MSLSSLGVPVANLGGPNFTSQALVRSVNFSMVASTATLTIGAGGFVDFFPGISEVVGFVRTVSAGTPGNPRIASTTAPAGGASTITINSDVAGDTSTYTMYYITPRIMGAGGQALLP